MIDQPSLSIFGTAVPKQFYQALSHRLLTNGFLARMIVLECRRRGSGREDGDSPLPDSILETARWWAEFRPGGSPGNLSEWHPEPRLVEQTDVARRQFRALREQADQAYTQAEARNDTVAISGLRGPGAMVAFDIVKSRGGNEPDADATKRVIQAAIADGLVLLSCGVHGNTIRLLMPLNIPDAILDEVEAFVTGARPRVEPNRVLATVLFTDIVDSTGLAGRMGDAAWRATLEEHQRTVREDLAYYRGREVKTTGDGFLATFDGPARAIHCARGMVRESAEFNGLRLRVGVHSGEIELKEWTPAR